MKTVTARTTCAILLAMALGLPGLLVVATRWAPSTAYARSISDTHVSAAAAQKTESDTSTNNPVPLINQPLVPDAVAPGGPEFTLTVNGTGFVSGSVVDWNGSALATTFVSVSQLTATVPTADIAAASTASVTVESPGPGGGPSNAVFFPITDSTTSVSLSKSDYAAGSETNGIVTADFNGDGKLDLAVANRGDNTLGVLLGNGDGTFQPQKTFGTGVNPQGPATADLNGDGKQDVVTANFLSNTVSVLLGNGDGTFQSHVDYATSGSPEMVAAADLNGDGKTDLAVAGFNSGVVSILLGNGDGTFQPHKDYPTAGGPVCVAVGDFNHDGKLDLALGSLNENKVAILLGNGDGTFQKHIDYGTGGTVSAVLTADFNGDGKLDLAVGTSIDVTSVLLGNGDGTFQTHVDYAPGCEAERCFPTAADLNGDGILDLIVPDINDTDLSVFLGNGDGTFQTPVNFAGSPEILATVAGDFNGDGRLDVGVANLNPTNTVSIFLQTTTVAVSTTSLDFATQLVGTSSSAQTVTLTNTGPIALTISSILASGDFLQTNACGSSLAAGASCTINVSFKPTAKGTRTGTLTITDNAGGSPQTVSLTGTGTVVKLSPARLNFGSQKVGTTSPPQTVTVTNTGSSTLSMTGVGITGTDFADFADTATCGNSLGQGQSCTITVTFTPRATGKRNASANVGDNGGGSPQKVALLGTGT